MQSELTFDSPEVDAESIAQNYTSCPAAGIHHGIPFEEYASWRAVNSGVVKWGAISPKHMHAAFCGDLKADDTRSMKLGRAIHCMLLEPDTFKERFIVSGPCEALLKTGDREGLTCGKNSSMLGDDDRWYCGVHSVAAPKLTGDILTQDEWNRCQKVGESIKAHWAVKLIRRKGWSEVSLVWEYAGLPMKGRLDRYADGARPVILDVKKCRVGYGTVERCQKAILDYQYHVQAAIYAKGVEALAGHKPEFIWVFVEDGPPFDVQLIPAAPEDLQIGWHIASNAIRRYARSTSENDHSGYIQCEEQIHPGGLPPWYVKQSLNAGWLAEGSEA